MNIITFPGIGITFNVSKVAVTILGRPITWYAIFIVVAICIAFIFYKKRDGLYKIKFADVFDLSLYLIPISFLGARLYYVLFNLDYYLKNPADILNISKGGLAIYGGIIAGAITCYIFSRKRKIDFLNLLDYLIPPIALGQSIGRWGNFVNIEAYGTETTNILRMGILENGIYKEVHPTFLYESFATFIIFLFLLFYQKKRNFRGEITYIYLCFYSFARAIIEPLRIDSLMIGKYRISHVLSIAILVILLPFLSKKVKNLHNKL